MNPDALEPVQTLDLRTTKCPLNFVKTKLALEKVSIGDVIEVWILAEAESALNIPKSIAQEGHQVIHSETETDGSQRLLIQKAG